MVTKTVRRARPLKVCLISPHPLVLEELRRWLVRSGIEPKTHRLDNSSIPGRQGPALPRASIYVVDGHGSRPMTESVIARISARHRTARLLVLANRWTAKTAFPLLRLGVKGLLSYAEARRQLPQALEAVAKGGFWAPRSLLSGFMDSLVTGDGRKRVPAGLNVLTAREQQVLAALLENLSNKEIAAKLHISERTAKFHVSNLLTKFEVQNRQELILHCLTAGGTAP
jgi:DNA-binding NarL/FixJ family response regulator